MSSLRSANNGASKPRSHNVNSVYSGKNTATTKASGPSKHGLQALGKATAVVRRMPPPATLKSLKAEHGQDPNIVIVPQGGTGWKSTDTDHKQNGSTDGSGGNAPDLRPTWAKSTTTNPGLTPVSSDSVTAAVSTTTPHHSQQSQGTAAQVVAGQTAAPPNNRDFPSLAASVAAVSGSKQPDATSLKPQKAGAWGTNVSEANMEIPHIPVVPIPQAQSGGYIGATAPKPPSDRKLPERFFSSQPPVAQSRVAAKIGIREKLARLSMESKEPSVDVESKTMTEPAQEPAKTPAEPPAAEPRAEMAAPSQPQHPMPPTDMPHHFSHPPPPLRSQDVRQLQPSQFPSMDQPPEWQQSQERYANGNAYDYEKHGRGDAGYGRMPPHGYQGGGFPGQQRFDERGHSYRDGPIEELGWGDDLPMDNRRGQPPPNRNARYRVDSQSSTEANGWQGNGPQYGHQNAPRRPMPSQNAGWYDNSGYPMAGGHDFSTPPPSYPPMNNYNQRSRNSSIATDYNGYDSQKGPRRHPENDYRQSYGSYSGEHHMHEPHRPPSHESQQHQPHHQQPPPSQQQQRMMNARPMQPSQQPQQQRYQQAEMPYRMLKRNDEKSAEYIAIHGGGPIMQQPVVTEQPKPKTKEPKPSKTSKVEDEKVTEPKAPVPAAPKENVWAKRIEEQKKEAAAPNVRYQQKLDYEFPSIHEAPKDISEWNPPPPPPPAATTSTDSNKRKGSRRNEGQYQPRDQHALRPRATTDAPPLDPEAIGTNSWVQQSSGPSWDNLSISTDHRVEEPYDDDNVYTGNKREFVNSKRSRGAQFNNTKSTDFSSRGSGQRGRGNSSSHGTVNNKKSAPAKTAFDQGKRPSKTDDTFSNMGEFHAEDYKIGEELPPQNQRHRQKDVFDVADTFDGSRHGSKRGGPRQPRGNNNWKGPDRQKPSEDAPKYNNEESFERQDSDNARGNGRRLAPMGGNNRGNSRFLSKHISKPSRHKPNETTSKPTRASADRNVEGMKSPPMSEGLDEWETASESSDVGGREEPSSQPPSSSTPTEPKSLSNGIKKNASDTVSNASGENSQADSISHSSAKPANEKSSRTNQKNVKPASHTFHGNGASAKNNNAYSNKNNNGNNPAPSQLNNKQRLRDMDDVKADNKDGKNARDTRKATTDHKLSMHTNELAGLDLNNASVIIIDNQPDQVRDEAWSEAGDFEEVLSKKQKKQRQLQVEEERRKEQKEKERLEKIQAKKNKALQQKKVDQKRKGQEKPSTEKDSSVPKSEPKKSKPTSPVPSKMEHDLGTSIWNNVRLTPTVIPTSVAEVQAAHIPSPIARPTKAVTSTSSTAISTTPASMTIDVSAVKDEFATFSIATSTVTTATTSACYDFAYDATIKKTSPIGTKPSPQPAVEPRKPSTDAIPLTPIEPMNSDHVQLKEKLDKVKDFWQGQGYEPPMESVGIDKTSLSQAHGPNVAKVKPQPQQPEPPQTAFVAPEAKTRSVEPFNVFAIQPSQSPNIYQRGNPVFAMGPTSPFRQLSSNQVYPMPYSTNDYIQPYNMHSNSPPNPSYFGQMNMNQPPPPRPQAFDGTVNNIFNTNPMWTMDISTPPLQQQVNQNRYVSAGSRPPSHPSVNGGMPTNFPPPTHMPPPAHMGYQQQQPPQNHSYIPTNMPPPPSMPHAYIEIMNVPPPIGAKRDNHMNVPKYPGPPPMQMMRPQFNNYNGQGMPPSSMPSRNQPSQRGPATVQTWQKQPQQPQQAPSSQSPRHPPQQQSTNFGGYFNMKPTNQPTA